MELNIGDTVMYREGGKLYEGTIKLIRGDKVEIDDDTIEQVIVATSKGTIADNLKFERHQQGRSGTSR